MRTTFVLIQLKDVLVDFGLGEREAEQLADGVRSGELLVFVRHPDDNDAIGEILDDSAIDHHAMVTTG